MQLHHPQPLRSPQTHPWHHTSRPPANHPTSHDIASRANSTFSGRVDPCAMPARLCAAKGRPSKWRAHAHVLKPRHAIAHACAALYAAEATTHMSGLRAQRRRLRHSTDGDGLATHVLRRRGGGRDERVRRTRREGNSAAAATAASHAAAASVKHESPRRAAPTTKTAVAAAAQQRRVFSPAPPRARKTHTHTLSAAHSHRPDQLPHTAHSSHHAHMRLCARAAMCHRPRVRCAGRCRLGNRC